MVEAKINVKTKIREAGLGNLCKNPESDFESAEMKSREAAFLETKPQSGSAKITI